MNRHDAIRELNESAAALQRMMGWREAQRRAARFRPDGTYRPADSANRSIADAALVREPIPGGRGAELWMTYTPGREEYLRLREDPILSNLTHLPRLCDPDALNGYVAFPKRTAPRVPKNSTGNIVQYIPVHGGITWARKDSYMAVWGFDTQHHNSESQPRSDQDWIRANCLLLYTGLMHAEVLWPEFRRADQSRRAELADQLLGLVFETDLVDKIGFEALIGAVFGRIGG